MVDLGERECFEFVVFSCGQVPNSFVVDQLVGVDFGVLLGSRFPPVIERDNDVIGDCLLECFELFLSSLQGFVVMSFNEEGLLDTVVEYVPEKCI